MAANENEKGGERAREPDDRWVFSLDPAIRALLDHVAEELAAEFVRLMKASGVRETDAEPKEGKR